MALADLLGISGLIAGAVSVVLGVVALSLAFYIFRSSKDSEAAIRSALEGIRAQTDTLSKIASQQMRGLTQIVREQIAQPDQHSTVMLEMLKSLSITPKDGLIGSPVPAGPVVGSKITDHGIPTMPAEVGREALREAMITGALALYYYTSHANVLAQSYMPTEEEYDEANNLHRLVREITDLSASDFRAIASMLDEWVAKDGEYVRGHRLHAIFGLTGLAVRDQVRNARETFNSKKTDIEA